jgi:RNA polymerase sigma-70 factor (ECF subfamily)
VERAEDAADEALTRIGNEEVQRILSLLSTDQRTVLLLRVVGDMSIEDVATAVGKRPGAVKALQRRGLAAVKRELGRKGVPL